MRFVLHSYRRCPFCIRSRIICYLKGIEYEVIEEPLRKWTAWMQEWSKVSGERPRVPVLEFWDVNGTHHVMPESNEINFFLDQVDGNPKFTPKEGTDGHIEMLEWWSWCDNEMKPALDLYKYGKDREWDPESNVYYMKELANYLGKLEEHLRGRDYIVEDRLTLADIAIIPFIRQIMRVRDGEFDFSLYPRTVRWADQLLDTDWFRDEVMKKHPLAPAGA